MTNIGTGHWVFAGAFVVVFILAMVVSYRKDLSRIGRHYRKVWLIILSAVVIYFIIFFLTRIT